MSLQAISHHIRNIRTWADAWVGEGRRPVQQIAWMHGNFPSPIAEEGLGSLRSMGEEGQICTQIHICPRSVEALFQMVQILSRYDMPNIQLLIGPTHEICTAFEHGISNKQPFSRAWMSFVCSIRRIGCHILFIDESPEPLNWLSIRIRERFPNRL